MLVTVRWNALKLEKLSPSDDMVRRTIDAIGLWMSNAKLKCRLCSRRRRLQRSPRVWVRIMRGGARVSATARSLCSCCFIFVLQQPPPVRNTAFSYGRAEATLCETPVIPDSAMEMGHKMYAGHSLYQLQYYQSVLYYI